MMQPSTVYEYPLWGVGLLLAGAAALGAIVLGLAVRPLHAPTPYQIHSPPRGVSTGRLL